MRLMMILAVLVLSGCEQTNQIEKLKAGCANTLKDRLKSPSSFKIIDFTDVSEPIVFEDEEAEVIQGKLDDLAGDESKEAQWEETKLRLRLDAIRREEPNGMLYKGYLTYDAANSFGTALRNTAFCEYESLDGRISDFAVDMSIKADGYNSTDWILKETEKYVQ